MVELLTRGHKAVVLVAPQKKLVESRFKPCCLSLFNCCHDKTLWQKQREGERDGWTEGGMVSAGSQFRGTCSLSQWEVQAAGTCSAPSTRKQRAMTSCCCSNPSLHFYSPGSQPREWCCPQWAYLHTSINVIKIISPGMSKVISPRRL